MFAAVLLFPSPHELANGLQLAVRSAELISGICCGDFHDRRDSFAGGQAFCEP
jgi:hypothetical protein